MNLIPSPKRTHGRRKDWYPYYAGFTSAFAVAAIQNYLGSANHILDPWNGSGTTTAAATQLQLSSFGIDLNPAMTLIARARQVPQHLANDLKSMAIEIIALSAGHELRRRDYEPLSTWLQGSSVSSVRSLQRAIHLRTGTDLSTELGLAAGLPSVTSCIPAIACFFYTALFAACRDLLEPFRGSNPTWIAYPASPRHRLRPSASRIHSAFQARVDYFAERLLVRDPAAEILANFATGSAESLLPGLGEFDACLTSPPYATRIDYIRSTAVELAVLGLPSSALELLRQHSIGTPVVRGVSQGASGVTCAAARLIELVDRHGSHGSANYYSPWLRNYLSRLHETLLGISSAVSSFGTIAIVVQDSYYKAIHIDLQHLVGESMRESGRRQIGRHDFAVRHLMSNVNARAREHLASRMQTESLLVFR